MLRAVVTLSTAWQHPNCSGQLYCGTVWKVFLGVRAGCADLSVWSAIPLGSGPPRTHMTSIKGAAEVGVVVVVYTGSWQKGRS